MSLSHTASQSNDRIVAAAYKLAVRFTEDADLPARFRRVSHVSAKSRKIKENSEIEIRFRRKVDSWSRIIETMIFKIDQDQAWRFIHSMPQVDGTISRITQNKDFSDFINYLILRRDVEKCDSDEIGGLALLSVAFQHELEKRIQA